MLFTIAIPAYKSTFLKECISSVLAQTIIDFELIIVNDCSPEPVDEIVKRFTDDRIAYYKNETNIGAVNLVNNWNNILARASGDFFVMMGDDDKMEPNYLATFKALIEKYPALDVFHCRSVIINETGEPIGLTPSWPEYESVYDNISHRTSTKRLQYVSDFVHRRSALVTNGGFYYLPLAWGSDDITAYIACGDKGIAHTNSPVFFYRSSGLTISSTGNYLQKLEANLLAKNWFDSFLLKSPTGKLDKIIYLQLKTKIDKYLYEQKLWIITLAIKDKPVENLIALINKRKRIGVSIVDIFKCFFRSIKTKICM